MARQLSKMFQPDSHQSRAVEMSAQVPTQCLSRSVTPKSLGLFLSSNNGVIAVGLKPRLKHKQSRTSHVLTEKRPSFAASAGYTGI